MGAQALDHGLQPLRVGTALPPHLGGGGFGLLLNIRGHTSEQMPLSA
jgi:hypothetical protein